MTCWPLPRAVRAAVFAAVCVALAATAHLGMAPVTLPPAAVAAGFAGTAGVTWLLAGRRRAAGVTALWMVTAQGALHWLFSWTATPSGHGSPTGAPHPTGVPQVHHGHPAHGAGEASGGAAPHEMSLGMLAAHLLAALVCALLMRYGETVLACLFAALGALAAGLLLLWPVQPPALPPQRSSTTRQGHSPRLVLLSYALIRRGPPLSACSV